jgi:poly(hydroxyalkanoate) granule-associated protein
MSRKNKLSDKKLAKQILNSAQEIWLAGLSMFANAEQEGGKMFEKWVVEGKKVEQRSRKIVGQAFDEAHHKALGNWQQLEQVFEQRVQASLHRLDIPDHRKLAALQQRIAELDAVVSTLTTARQAPVIDTTQSEPMPSVPVTEFDDLTRIKGIGPKMEERLVAAGIHSYRQIAGWQETDIDHFQQAISVRQFKARIRENEWVEQARQLFQQKYNTSI